MGSGVVKRLGKTFWTGSGVITLVMMLSWTGRVQAAGCSHPWLNENFPSHVLGFTSLEQAGALPTVPERDVPPNPKPCRGAFCSGSSPGLPLPSQVIRPDRWTDPVFLVQASGAPREHGTFWFIEDAAVEARIVSAGVFHPPR